jgi:hypothetical protein
VQEFGTFGYGILRGWAFDFLLAWVTFIYVTANKGDSLVRKFAYFWRFKCIMTSD